MILRTRRAHVLRARETLASPEKVRLDWIRNLAAGFAGLDFLVLLYLLHFFAGLPLPRRPDVVLHLAIAAFILTIGYLGLRRPEVFSGGEKALSSGLPDTAADGAREPARVPAEDVRRLVEYTEREKPFLDPDLTLFDLARSLSLPPYQVSAILNRGLGKTFFAFVNGFRVEEAKRRLLDPAAGRTKILALAFECGFNSKSAFNRVFKDLTGLTPSEFQRSRRSG